MLFPFPGSLLVVVLAGLVVFPACAVSAPETAPDPVAERRELAQPAAPERSETAPASGSKNGSKSGGGNTTGADEATSGAPDENGDPGSDPGAGGQDLSLAGRAVDPRGDARGSPDYADAVGVTIHSSGRLARVTVEMAGVLPDSTERDEVVGVGVDLAKPDGDYQVFGSGEPDGWFGYLSGPRGLKSYEGTFEVTGRALVFTVPWSALGGAENGTFSAFVDWTGGGDAGEDRVADATAFRP